MHEIGRIILMGGVVFWLSAIFHAIQDEVPVMLNILLLVASAAIGIGAVMGWKD